VEEKKRKEIANAKRRGKTAETAISSLFSDSLVVMMEA
jgi:hypothetical protein